LESISFTRSWSCTNNCQSTLDTITFKHDSSFIYFFSSVILFYLCSLYQKEKQIKLSVYSSQFILLPNIRTCGQRRLFVILLFFDFLRGRVHFRNQHYRRKQNTHTHTYTKLEFSFIVALYFD